MLFTNKLRSMARRNIPAYSRFSLSIFTVIALFAASTANASLILTAAGSSLGFNLSTFVSGDAGSFTPFGMGVNNKGQVIVSSWNTSLNYVFNDTDNQTVANAVSYTPATYLVAGYTSVKLDGIRSVWGGAAHSWWGGGLAKFNDDGTIAAYYDGIKLSYGIWTNPVNQHIIAQGSVGLLGGLLDIDVSGATPTVRLITTDGTDGLTVSPDGSRVYTNSASYDINTGVKLGNFSVPGADGMGIITSSNAALNGQVIVNTYGSVIMMDPVTYAQTIIASGDLIGDLAAADYNNGSLLLTAWGNFSNSHTSSIMRLSCNGCAIGSAPPSSTHGVPEPNELALMGIGVIFLSAMVRRRKQPLQA